MDGRIKRIFEINKELLQLKKLSSVLDIIIDSAIEITKAQRGFLMLKDEGPDLFIEIARNFEKENLDNNDIEISRSIIEKVISSGKLILVHNACTDKRFKMHHSVQKLSLKSVLCMPLKNHEVTQGAIYLDNKLSTGLFREEDIQLLETISAQASLAINNAKLLELLESKNEAIHKLNQELEIQIDEQREEMEEVKEELKRKEVELKERYHYDKLIGKSAQMQYIYNILDRVSTSTLPVVIYGESGTGKELVAKALHYNSPCSSARFVSENCASIPETLLESELFGFKRGSFTGADRDREGLFKLADGGTLFLDEIGDMSFSMQAKILRVLQENEIRPIGAKEAIGVNVRIIAATNRDLKKMISEGFFREDLYYRLNVIQINLPPLRERLEDIPLLIEHLLDRITLEQKEKKKTIDRRAMRFLLEYDWPGNVRELENVLERAFVLSEKDRITMESLGDNITRRHRFLSHHELFKNAERIMIEKVLLATGGDKSKAALEIGWNRQKLYRRMKVLGIPLDFGKN
jgi:transcriptional regulator with GAF, ATPase, and Fis domain